MEKQKVVERAYRILGRSCWVRVCHCDSGYRADSNDYDAYTLLNTALDSTECYGYRKTWEEAQVELDKIASDNGWEEVKMLPGDKFWEV